MTINCHYCVSAEARCQGRGFSQQCLLQVQTIHSKTSEGRLVTSCNKSIVAEFSLVGCWRLRPQSAFPHCRNRADSFSRRSARRYHGIARASYSSRHSRAFLNSRAFLTLGVLQVTHSCLPCTPDSSSNREGIQRDQSHCAKNYRTV